MSGIRSGFSAMLVGAVVVVMSVGTGAQRAGASDAGKQLERARQKEVVEGNISGAIVEYRAIADRFKTSDRPAAAKALLLLANAYTALNDARAAAIFAELARDFGDLPEGAAARSSAAVRPQRGLQTADDPRDETRRAKRRVWGHRYLTGRPSPDGRFLPWANHGELAKPGGPGVDLVLHDLKTGTDRPVTKSMHDNDRVRAATFTPDGKQLLYTWFDARRNEWQIRLVDADGRNDRLVREGVSTYLGVVAPAGQRAAVAVNATSGDQLAMLDLRTGAMQTLRTAEWGVELGNFSPDGRYIVCSELVRQGAEERNIDILAVDGSRKTTIVSGSSNRHPFFTPDGRYVVFTSNRSGQWDLWMVPVAGGASAGAAVMADSSIGAVTLLGFATDGTLFYQQPVDRNQAWEVDIDPETRQAAGSPRPLSTRFAGNQIAPTWSPDGSRLVFATRRTAGAGTLEGPFSFTVSEGGVERTTEAPGTIIFEFTRTLRWFPDRESLLLAEWRTTGGRVFSRFDLTTGRRDVLFRGPSGNALSTSLSSDGTSLFYVVADETDRNLRHIVRRVLASGDERRITTVTGNLQGLALSPDGRTIGFLLRHQMPSWCLWTVPADGGEAREVWEPPSGQILFGRVEGGTVWAVDGRGLFVTIREGTYDGPQSLWYVPLDITPARAIGVAMEQVSASSAHPDGRRLAFTSTTSSRDVWTLSNLRSD